MENIRNNRMGENHFAPSIISGVKFKPEAVLARGVVEGTDSKYHGDIDEIYVPKPLSNGKVNDESKSLVNYSGSLISMLREFIRLLLKMIANSEYTQQSNMLAIQEFTTFLANIKVKVESQIKAIEKEKSAAQWELYAGLVQNIATACLSVVEFLKTNINAQLKKEKLDHQMRNVHALDQNLKGSKLNESGILEESKKRYQEYKDHFKTEVRNEINNAELMEPKFEELRVKFDKVKELRAILTKDINDKTLKSNEIENKSNQVETEIDGIVKKFQDILKDNKLSHGQLDSVYNKGKGTDVAEADKVAFDKAMLIKGFYENMKVEYHGILNRNSQFIGEVNNAALNESHSNTILRSSVGILNGGVGIGATSLRYTSSLAKTDAQVDMANVEAFGQMLQKLSQSMIELARQLGTYNKDLAQDLEQIIKSLLQAISGLASSR